MTPMTKMLARTLAFCFAAALLLPVTGSAQNAITTFSSCTRIGSNGFTHGWEFTINTGIYVTQHGYVSPSIGTFTDNHSTRIWDVNGTVITAQQVPSTADTSNNYAWVTLDEPVYLPPGRYRIGSLSPSGFNSDAFVGNCSSTSFGPEITYVKAVRNSSGFDYPNQNYGDAEPIANPNFRYQLWTPTPTPTLTPTETPTPSPTFTATPATSGTPTPTGTSTPLPGATPTPTPPATVPVFGAPGAAILLVLLSLGMMGAGSTALRQE